MKAACAAIALVALLCAAPLVAAAEQGWAYDVANEMMSPYCPGRALSECPSPQAADLRAWIVAQERAGASREQVEETLYAEFGDQLRQAPRPEGLGLLAYVIPVVLVVAGALVLGVFFRHVRSRREARGEAAPGAPTPRDPDPELLRRVDAELAAAERAD